MIIASYCFFLCRYVMYRYAYQQRSSYYIQWSSVCNCYTQEQIKTNSLPCLEHDGSTSVFSNLPPGLYGATQLDSPLDICNSSIN